MRVCRLRHRPVDTPDFDFSGANDDGTRHHHHQQGGHRLANADEHQQQQQSQHAAGGKYAKPRASGAAITPGASLVVATGERHLSQKVRPVCGWVDAASEMAIVTATDVCGGCHCGCLQYLPPTKQSDFLANLTDQSAKRAASKPAGATMSRSSTMSSPPRPQRMRASVSLLELGSAPSTTTSINSSNNSETETTPSAAARDIQVSSDTTRMLGWTQKPRAAAAAAVAAESATRMRGKPRVELTPNKESVGKKRLLEPTRSSSRQLALAAARGASSVPRRNIDAQMSLKTTVSIADSIMRRTTRQRAAKKTDGTADQPIHLDSDSDNDASPPPRKRVSPPEPAPLASKRKARVRLLNPPHWKNVDLEAIQRGVTYDDAPVWIGRVRCIANVCVHDGSVWLTVIRYEPPLASTASPLSC